MAGVAQRVTSSRSIGVVGHWYRCLLAGYYHMASDDDRPDVEPHGIYIQSFGRHHGVAVGDEHPTLQFAPQALTSAKARMRQWGVERDELIVLHCGPSWPVKQWLEAHWVTLVRELKARGFESILQLGAANPLTLGADKASAKIAGTLPLEEPLALEESIALISQARLFIGIDSGLLHLATALHIPAVSLWGATSPQFLFAGGAQRWFVTSPVACQGCHHRVPRLHWMTDCPYHIACMQAIEPKAVLDAALAALSMKR
jgi:ADP-heptose:LPS heptosyltransferase